MGSSRLAVAISKQQQNMNNIGKQSISWRAATATAWRAATGWVPARNGWVCCYSIEANWKLCFSILVQMDLSLQFNSYVFILHLALCLLT